MTICSAQWSEEGFSLASADNHLEQTKLISHWQQRLHHILILSAGRKKGPREQIDKIDLNWVEG
jgi:hypothetical protein